MSRLRVCFFSSRASHPGRAQVVRNVSAHLSATSIMRPLCLIEALERSALLSQPLWYRYVIRGCAVMPSFTAPQLARFLMLLEQRRTRDDVSNFTSVLPSELAGFIKESTNFPNVNDNVLLLKGLARCGFLSSSELQQLKPEISLLIERIISSKFIATPTDVQLTLRAVLKLRGRIILADQCDHGVLNSFDLGELVKTTALSSDQLSPAFCALPPEETTRFLEALLSLLETDPHIAPVAEKIFVLSGRLLASKGSSLLAALPSKLCHERVKVLARFYRTCRKKIPEPTPVLRLVEMLSLAGADFDKVQLEEVLSALLQLRARAAWGKVYEGKQEAVGVRNRGSSVPRTRIDSETNAAFREAVAPLLTALTRHAKVMDFEELKRAAKLIVAGTSPATKRTSHRLRAVLLRELGKRLLRLQSLENSGEKNSDKNSGEKNSDTKSL